MSETFDHHDRLDELVPDNDELLRDAPMCSCGRTTVGGLIHPDGTLEYDEWCRICDDDGGLGRGDQ